jgi:hypothetical protein
VHLQLSVLCIHSKRWGGRGSRGGIPACGCDTQRRTRDSLTTGMGTGSTVACALLGTARLLRSIEEVSEEPPSEVMGGIGRVGGGLHRHGHCHGEVGVQLRVDPKLVEVATTYVYANSATLHNGCESRGSGTAVSTAEDWGLLDDIGQDADPWRHVDQVRVIVLVHCVHEGLFVAAVRAVRGDEGAVQGSQRRVARGWSSCH